MSDQQEDDYGWFSAADFDRVLQAIARHNHPERYILVGGQSLVGWAILFKIPIPTTGYPALTQDADFFGTKAEAEFLAQALDATVKIATIDDNTPNTAVLTWQSPSTGKKLTLDFLSSLIGLDSEDICKMAVQVQFPEQAPVFMLHPLLCLTSRFENLLLLRNKRNGNGITQARVAVDVARHYLLGQIASGSQDDERQALRAVTRIVDTAMSKAGLFVYFEYGIDPMTAVDPAVFKHYPLFATKDWPNRVRRVEEKRRKERALREHAQRQDRLRPKGDAFYPPAKR